FAARLRAPGNNADTFHPAQRQHFALLLAIEQVDEVLHADEAGPAVLLGNAEGASELPSVHRRGADVARFAGLDDIMQRCEALLLREPPGMIAEIATAVAHAAEANARDIETGAAELGIFHRLSKPVKSIMRSAG